MLRRNKSNKDSCIIAKTSADIKALRIISDIVIFTIFSVLIVAPSYSQSAGGISSSQHGSRPGYIYDRANIISTEYESLIDNYVRDVDDNTTAEIVVYTIPSFIGHGIKNKDGQEIQDRDALANYIFNEVSLDGIKGIGKKGKDNGVLVLLSLKRDAGGGSMRIEVGRGLEGTITDGTAGEILINKHTVDIIIIYSIPLFNTQFYLTNMNLT